MSSAIVQGLHKLRRPELKESIQIEELPNDSWVATGFSSLCGIQLSQLQKELDAAIIVRKVKTKLTVYVFPKLKPDAALTESDAGLKAAEAPALFANAVWTPYAWSSFSVSDLSTEISKLKTIIQCRVQEDRIWMVEEATGDYSAPPILAMPSRTTKWTRKQKSKAKWRSSTPYSKQRLSTQLKKTGRGVKFSGN